jgi:predicted dienelactone hydrolase
MLESVWKGVKPRQMMQAIKKAASAKNAKLRYEDVAAVIDGLVYWNSDKDHSLHHKIDLKHIGMSGHSFGALTTQGVSGQQAFGGLVNFTDDRIKAAVAFSPSSPRAGKPERAFGKVEIPWMLMTGTKDLSPNGFCKSQYHYEHSRGNHVGSNGIFLKAIDVEEKTPPLIPQT